MLLYSLADNSKAVVVLASVVIHQLIILKLVRGGKVLRREAEQ